MTDQPAGPAGNQPVDVLGQLAVKMGKATQEQVNEARALVQKMKDLGVERDTLGALVDRQVMSSGDADKIRMSAKQVFGQASAPAPAATPAAPAGPAPIQVGAPAPSPKAAPASAPGPRVDPATGELIGFASNEIKHPVAESTAPCIVHPDMSSVANCIHCGRPACKNCVIRTERGTFCSQGCMDGSRNILDAKAGLITASVNKAIQIGRLLYYVAAIAIIVAIVLTVRYVFNDYRFTNAMNEAEASPEGSKDSLAAYKRAAELRPEDAKAQLGLGKGLLKSNEVGTAIETLLLAKKLDPKNPDVLKVLADAHTLKSNYSQAAESLEALRELDAATSATERQLGILYQDNLARPEDAITAFGRSMEIGAESRELRYRLGRVYTGVGKYDEAAQQFALAVKPVEKKEGANQGREKAFLADRGKVSAIHVARADLALKQNDKPGALACIAEAHDADLSNLPALKMRVQLMRELGQGDDVKPVVESSRGMLAANGEFLQILASVQSAAGDGASYLKTARALYTRDPKQPGALEAVVNAEVQFGSPDNALAILKKLGRKQMVAAKFIPAWEEIVRSKLSANRLKEAESLLRSLGESGDSDPRLAALWCDVLHRQGRGSDALERAMLAIRKHPNTPTPHLIVGSVLRLMGRTREAMKRVKKAISLGAGGIAQRELALMWWDAGVKESAARHLVAALNDIDMPARVIELTRLELKRLRGPGFPVSRDCYIERYIGDLLKSPIDAPESTLLYRIHIASYGIAREFAIVAGTTTYTAVGNEAEQIQGIEYVDDALRRPDAFDRIHAIYEKSVKACGEAARSMMPTKKASQIDEILSRYAEINPGASNAVASMAEASSTQAKLFAAWLNAHVNSDELALQVRMALGRMRSRTVRVPGNLQKAVAGDFALADLIMIGIAAGRSGPVYQTAAESAMSTMVSRASAATDPLQQLLASRAGVFNMLRVMARQIHENGRMPTASNTHNSDSRVANATHGGAE